MEAQIQFAAILIPVLGILITSVVDSVDDQDSLRYRIVVLSLVFAILAPLGSAVSLAIFSGTQSVSQSDLIFYTGITLLLTAVLLVVVSMKEVNRGRSDDEWMVIPFLVGSIVFLVFFILALW